MIADAFTTTCVILIWCILVGQYLSNGRTKRHRKLRNIRYRLTLVVCRLTDAVCRLSLIIMNGNAHLPVHNYYNKAIRDGKYLAPPHASAWQRSPH